MSSFVVPLESCCNCSKSNTDMNMNMNMNIDPTLLHNALPVDGLAAKSATNSKIGLRLVPQFH